MMISRIIQVLFILLVSAPAWQTASAQIYKWKDADGKTHFGDRVPANHEGSKVKAPDTPATVNLGKPEIIVYTTSWCGYCKKAKAYFSANKMPYTEYNIEKDRFAKRQYDRINGRGVPVILVGDQRLNGFSQDSFERLYAFVKEPLIKYKRSL
jgi:glutaredoxin